jgi:hypothetical protein
LDEVGDVLTPTEVRAAIVDQDESGVTCDCKCLFKKPRGRSWMDGQDPSKLLIRLSPHRGRTVFLKERQAKSQPFLAGQPYGKSCKYKVLHSGGSFVMYVTHG